MIMLCGGVKGGAGRTTISTNFAAILTSIGKDVLFVDTDVQLSSTYWVHSRDKDLPKIHTVQCFGDNVAEQVESLAPRFDEIVIDAGGRDSAELRSALVIAHKCICPISPSQFDTWSLGQFNSMVQDAKTMNKGLEVLVVVNAASTHPNVAEYAEIDELMPEFPHLELSERILHDRIAYRKAAKSGRAVFELKPMDDKCVLEIGLLQGDVYPND